MKLSYLSLALILNIIGIYVQAQAYSAAELDRLVLAYTFYLKQKISLEVVASKYPSLKESAQNASNTWNREFMTTVKNIDANLMLAQNTKWEKTRAEIVQRFAIQDYTDVTENKAKQYIQTVNERGYGQIQSPILETFLNYKPQYQKHPEDELADGYFNYFIVRNINKTYPLNIKVVYPKSWKAVSITKKPKFKQQFVSYYGFGSIKMTLTIEPARTDYQNDMFQQLLSKKNLQKYSAANDIVLNYRSELTIDNCPAASLIVYHIEVGKETTIFGINETYSVYYKNFHIVISFSSTSTLSQDDAMAKYDIHKALMNKIVNNIVILSQWGQ